MKLFLSKEAIPATSLQIDAASTVRSFSGRAFRESITVEVLNPKTAIFYVAFLPQFTDPGAAFPVWLQVFILGTVVNMLFTSADLICVLLADRVTGFLRASRSASRMAQRIGGSILIALGLNVALNRH